MDETPSPSKVIESGVDGSTEVSSAVHRRESLTEKMISMLASIQEGSTVSPSGKYPVCMFRGSGLRARPANTYRALYRKGLVVHPIDSSEDAELTDAGQMALNRHRDAKNHS